MYTSANSTQVAHRSLTSLPPAKLSPLPATLLTLGLWLDRSIIISYSLGYSIFKEQTRNYWYNIFSPIAHISCAHTIKTCLIQYIPLLSSTFFSKNDVGYYKFFSKNLFNLLSPRRILSFTELTELPSALAISALLMPRKK